LRPHLGDNLVPLALQGRSGRGRVDPVSRNAQGLLHLGHVRRVRQLRPGLLAPTETSQSPVEARPKCRASTGVSAGAQAVQQNGRCSPTRVRVWNNKTSRHQNRRGGGVSPDGRARARGRMLRRAALIAGALVLLTVVLLLTGHWVLAIIFAVPAFIAVW